MTAADTAAVTASARSRRSVAGASPSTQSEKLFDNAAAAIQATGRVSMHLDRAWRHQVFKQIDYLLSPNHWDALSTELNIASFESLLRFVIYAQVRAVPRLGIAPSGRTLALWAHSAATLEAEFFVSDRARGLFVSRAAEAPFSTAFEGPTTLIPDWVRGLGGAALLSAP